ncbi:17550_t:CDS:2 [Acaulospora colombiana]|uniref:17550_t:CDS:1 n=1 Tax=Acaulospora colombiana TaxID=27376 RepID=A0ACA9MSC4_9GLOM|nr:17550_t:CDS:2 [Acaulospora colombiana]
MTHQFQNIPTSRYNFLVILKTMNEMTNIPIKKHSTIIMAKVMKVPTVVSQRNIRIITTKAPTKNLLDVPYFIHVHITPSTDHIVIETGDAMEKGKNLNYENFN